jgi:hypothetical protein
MEKIEFIAEAKKRGFSDSSIQERLELYELSVRENCPMDYDFFLGSLQPSDAEITCTESSVFELHI